jgi:hypothetical protein
LEIRADSTFAAFSAWMPEFNALLGLKGLFGLEASAPSP